MTRTARATRSAISSQNPDRLFERQHPRARPCGRPEDRLYSYPSSGSSSVRAHAVSSITGSVNGVTNPSYSYDANGNLTSGAGRTLTWTGFNMALSIAQGTTTISYGYDADHTRITQTDSAGTTYYVNDPGSGAAEEKNVSGGVTTWKTYISAGGHLVAERSAVSGGSTTWQYFIADHLGSTAIVLNASGSVISGGRLAYDPWGRMRNSDGMDDTLTDAGLAPQGADKRAG